MPVLGLAGCHWRKTGKLQVRFHRNIAASSLAADCNVPQRPPAKLEVLYLSRWFTHTHTKKTDKDSRSDKLGLNPALLKGPTYEPERDPCWWFLAVLGLAARHFKEKKCRHVFVATWVGLHWPMPSKGPWAPSKNYEIIYKFYFYSEVRHTHCENLWFL